MQIQRKAVYAGVGLAAGGLLGWLTLALAVPPPQGGMSGTAQAGSPNFTQAQASSGQQVYTAHCQNCHGAQLQGVAGPALAGNSFQSKWLGGNHTLSDLYSVISKQMPLNAPGSLSQKQYQDVTAFILSRNGFVAGKTALGPQTLKVKLTAPKASGQNGAAGAGGAGKAASMPVPANLPKVMTAGNAAAGSAPGDQELQNPKDGDWLFYNRDYQGQRFSPLKQITPDNAGSLNVKCVFQLGEIGSFQTGPVVYQGLMYITSVHNTYALKADTCTKVWESDYTPKGPEPQPANRGVALYNGTLYRGTTDGHLLALDAKTGKVQWDTWVADSNKGYFLSAAPIAANGLVFIGEAGADWGANGHMRAFDAKTGKQVWSFGVIPTGNEAGAETWKKGSEHGGGSMWTSFTLDTASKLLYVSVGNPAPDFNGGLRPGDNLYTDSVIVLDARTGKLAWYAQQVPHDTHDWDTAAAPLIYEQGGKKFMAVANKGGWLYIYDRATHKLVSQQQTTTHLNSDKPVSLTGRRDCPGILGGVEWNGPAVDAQQNVMYVNSVDWCATYKIGETRYVDGSLYFGGDATFDPVKNARGWTRAYNAATGAPMWQVKQATPMIAGITPTAGGVIFTGDQNGDFMAMDAKNGNRLYTFRTGGAIGGGVVTYTVGDQQYVATTSGNASRSIWSTTGSATIFVFGLPQGASGAGTSATSGTSGK